MEILTCSQMCKQTIFKNILLTILKKRHLFGCKEKSASQKKKQNFWQLCY